MMTVLHHGFDLLNGSSSPSTLSRMIPLCFNEVYVKDDHIEVMSFA